MYTEYGWNIPGKWGISVSILTSNSIAWSKMDFVSPGIFLSLHFLGWLVLCSSNWCPEELRLHKIKFKISVGGCVCRGHRYFLMEYTDQKMATLLSKITQQMENLIFQCSVLFRAQKVCNIWKKGIILLLHTWSWCVRDYDLLWLGIDICIWFLIFAGGIMWHVKYFSMW